MAVRVLPDPLALPQVEVLVPASPAFQDMTAWTRIAGGGAVRCSPPDLFCRLSNCLPVAHNRHVGYKML